jgi:hypothetical protein
MEQNTISQLEQQILRILKDEYSFYQSLYILLDRQRDAIRYQKDENLLDLYAEIERCQKRITESEQKISSLRQVQPQMFRVAAIHPEIKKLVNSIVTLVKKNITLVSENEDYTREKYERIQKELGELKSSHKIMQYLSVGDPSPQFVDGKK